MKRLFLFSFFTLPCYAAITNIQASGATPREVILQYVAPTPAACTIEVSESATYTPLVNDVNTALFTGSSSDFRNGAQGRERTFVIGAAGTGINYAPKDLTGKRSSRALQTNTDHFYRLTCGTDVATGTIRTANIAPGDTHPVDPVPIDPLNLGDTAWPFLPWDASAGVIDPVTGVFIQQMYTYESNIGGVDYSGPYNILTAYDETATWTNIQNLLPATITDEAQTPNGTTRLATVANASIYVAGIRVKQASGTLMTQAGDLPSIAPGYYYNWGNGTYQFDPSDLGGKLITYTTNANDGVVASYTGSANNPVKVIGNRIGIGVTLYVKGFVDNITTTTEACLMIDGATCYGPWVPFTLPVGSGSIATVAVGDPNTYTTTITTAPMLSAWLSANQQFPQVAFNKSGTASNIGNVLTLVGPNAGSGSFDPRWTTSTHIIYAGVDYKVLSVTNGITMTVTPTPASNTSGSWQSYQYGYQVHKSSVGGTVSIDFISEFATPNVAQVNDQGSGGTKQCTVTEYHQGWRIGMDRGSAASAATNASPIVITTTTAHDFITGDVVKIRDVPGNTAANGTWTVTVTGARTFSLNSSTGNGVFPSDVSDLIYNGGGGLVWKLTSPTGNLCVVSSATGGQEMYWVNTKISPKTLAYLGPLMTQTVGFDGGIVAIGATFGEEDPEIPSIYRLYLQSGVQNMWKGFYIGAQPTGMFQAGARWVRGGQQNPSIGVWRMINLTASPSITAKLQAFDATFPSGVQINVVASPKPGKIAFSAIYGQQNNKGWLGVYDTVSNSIVALMNTWSSSNARWAGLHTPFPWEGADQYSWVPYNLDGKDGENGVMSNKGPYRMNLTSGAMNTTPTDCATQLTAIGQSNPLGVTGNLCSTVTVDTIVPTTPSTATPASDTLNNQGLRVGDLMKMTDQTAATTARPWGQLESEAMKVLGFNVGTKQIVVQRAFVGVGSIEASTADAHANGDHFYMYSNSTPRWWDWVNAPHGDAGTDPYQQNLTGNILDTSFPDESHYFTRNAFSVSDAGGLAAVAGASCSGAADPNSAEYGYRFAAWPGHVSPPVSAFGCVSGNPPFDGVYGSGSGNYLEKHPSPVELMALNMSWFDYRPLATQPAFGDNGNPTINQLTTKVAGATYIYKTIRSGLLGTNIDPKRGVVYAMIGRHTSYDVSAAGFTLPDTSGYNYTHCTVYVAGECWSGSSIGDIYTNAPYVSPILAALAYAGQYNCISKQEGWNYADYFVNDICIVPQSPYTDYAVQYSALHDPYNTGARRITAGLRYPRTSGLTENSPATPLGDGLMMGSQINGGAFGALLMPKVPPYPGPQRGINRGTWIPIPIYLSSVPAGTNNVIVEFGYNPNLYCATRQESCIANASSITTTVYSYSTSDSPAGLSCSSGCTPVIPALSQRVMFYRVKYRNAGNAVIKTGDVKVIATP